MKKFAMITLCLALGIVSYTFAAQTLTVHCSGGNTVSVSNVPDSMTSSDLNADYRCPRNGGTWAVSFSGDVAGSGDVSMDLDVEANTEIAVDSTGSMMDDEVLVSLEIERSASGLVAVNLQDAIDYLFVNGLTMYGTEEEFMGSHSLRRDEAAAFFARFARDVLGMQVDADATCAFSDLAGAHQDLIVEISAACQLGLFKGYEGKFMPTASFTNAEALTVLVRLLDGDKEEVAGNWAANYYAFAQEAGLTVSLDADTEANLSNSITRADVAKLIEAGSAYVKIEGIAGESQAMPAPVFTTDAATHISSTGAILHANIRGLMSVHYDNFGQTLYFMYGTSVTNLDFVSASTGAIQGSRSTLLNDLSPSTTYYFRAVANLNTGSYEYGNIMNFTTE